MITRIEATKYRCFDRLGIDLGPYGVVVGANGAGNRPGRAKGDAATVQGFYFATILPQEGIDWPWYGLPISSVGCNHDFLAIGQ